MSFLDDWWKVWNRPKGRGPIFEFYKGRPDWNGHPWYIRERATNGRIVMTGGEGYASKWNVRRAAYARAARTEGATVRHVDIRYEDD